MQSVPKFKRTAEESSEDENIRSWVLFALRETMEQQSIRNNVLKEFLHKLFKSSGYKPIYGRTLNNRKTQKSLITYLTKIISTYPPDQTSKYVVMFTVSNLYDEDTHETHFQTFVYIPGYKSDIVSGPIIFCFDPSRTCDQEEGIYGAHAVDEVDTIVSKIDSDITLLYPNVTEACQIHENDVFCQSWSLYLQIHGVVRFLQTGNLNYAPDIPLSQFHKYEILLNFYKSIVPIICVELNKVYKKLPGLPKKYMIDPCDLVSKMECTFKNDVVSCSLCGPPQDKSAACPEILLQKLKSQKTMDLQQTHQFNSYPSKSSIKSKRRRSKRRSRKRSSRKRSSRKHRSNKHRRSKKNS